MARQSKMLVAIAALVAVWPMVFAAEEETEPAASNGTKGVLLLQVGRQQSKTDEASEESTWPSSRCPPEGFNTQGALEGGFDIKWYVSAKWYVQQQMVVQYLPADFFYCVTAEYKLLDKPTRLGYDIEVDNQARNAEGELRNENGRLLGAKIVDAAAGKLKVAPMFLPPLFAGPYWVVAFSVEDEWAVISGGPPKRESGDACKTGKGINNSGLWIFSRKRQAPAADIAAARAAAEAKGFDLSVLKEVNQSNCPP